MWANSQVLIMARTPRLLKLGKRVQNPVEIRIPTDLLWIMDYPDEWDRKVESAGNITWVAETFKDLVSGLHVMEDDPNV